MAGATSKSKNIYHKLADARLQFLKESISKSGVNEQAEFEYFELGDIVPKGTKILANNGLLFVTSFPGGVPTGTLYDMDSSDIIIFSCDRVNGEITGIKGGRMMNAVQSEGAKQTYFRRYLWMQVLDITARDEIDDKEFDNNGAVKKTAPVSQEKRNEIKKELADSSAPADELQIGQLKKALKMLNDCSGDYEEFIAEVAVKTNNFTNLTKDKCEKLILEIGSLIDEAKKEG